MPAQLDTRDAHRAYATKDNIVPDASGPTNLPAAVFKIKARDTTAGASALVTDTVSAAAVDSGNLAAGTYEVFFVGRHRGAAAVDRGLQLCHRNAADNANIEVLAYVDAGAEVTYRNSAVVLLANESFVVLTDSDATNLGLEADLVVTKVA